MLKDENLDDDEQEVPVKFEDNDDEPPSKKAKKMLNSTYNERFGVSHIHFSFNTKSNSCLECYETCGIHYRIHC